MTCTERHCGSALVLVAHGSHSESWNDQLRALAGAVARRAEVRAAYRGGVHLAFLSASTPRVGTLVETLARQRTPDIAVLPVLLVPAVHWTQDLPVLVGLVTDSPRAAMLRARGEPLCGVRAPVRIVTPSTLPDAVCAGVVRRALARAPDPARTGVVVAMYGSNRHRDAWLRFASRVEGALERAGFAAARAAFVAPHVEGGGPAAAAEAARTLLGTCARVVFASALVAVGSLQREAIPAALDALPGEVQRRIDYVADAVLPDDAIADAMAQAALTAAREASALPR